ncbi:indolepyruvate decarboxylase [Candidatus Gastranaerophilus sp. (ex Termes propinquus)]|nr:indolepyruvate decarboxylase [Candidatus Gastranaerophilus sp. (ex Termes propinquus)]
MDKQTIGQYLIQRLSELGIAHVFGVPGDYNFNLIDAIEENPSTDWIGCCNELNAGYAADGYARVKGMGAVLTTYGVGELSVINAIAGAYAESLPVINIVGMLRKSTIDARKVVHHTLGSDYNVFKEIYSKVTAYSAVLSEENAQDEIENALSVAYYQKKPVYIGIYDDICNNPIIITRGKLQEQRSDEKELQEAVEHIRAFVERAKNPVIISEFPILRYGLKKQMQEFIEQTGFLATTMVTGKGSVDETSENFIGTYCGKLLESETAKIVETSDCILGFGILMSDLNTGCFSSELDFSNVVDIQASSVTLDGKTYKNVYMQDVLYALADKLSAHKNFTPPKNTDCGYSYIGPSDKLLSQEFLYSFLQNYLKDGDIYITETGLATLGSIPMRLPSNTIFCTSALWASIGWAVPACLGTALANRSKRPILLCGEGACQMSYQEISTMLRQGVKPIIIIINNEGYTIERLLSRNPTDEYNEIAKWDYTKLLEGFSGECKTYKVWEQKQFVKILNKARDLNKLVFIEAFTDTLDAPVFAKKFAEYARIASHSPQLP